MATQDTQEKGFDQFFDEFAAARDKGVAPPAEGSTTAAAATSEQSTAAKPGDKAAAAAAAAKPAEPVEPAWISKLPAEDQELARADWKAKVAAEKKNAEDAEKLTRMSGQVNAYQKRHDALLKQVREGAPQTDGKTAVTAAAESTAAAAKAASAQATSFQWDKFAEQFPEIASAIETRFQDVKSKVEAVKAEIDPLAEDREERIRETGAAAIEAAHPQWTDTARSPEFKEWFSKQPVSLQGLASSENPEDTIMVLDFFKASTGKTTQAAATNAQTQTSEAATAAADQKAADLAAKRQKQLDDAVGVPSGRPRSEASASAPEDFAAAFNFFAAKRDRERRAAQQA